MLFLIGLGLRGIQDLTLGGFDVLKSCDRIYLDNYTCVVFNNDGVVIDIVEELKSLLLTKAEYIIADRELVESGTDMIRDAKNGLRTAFLVVGDPLAATTHTDLILRAVENNIEYQVFQNASIINAVLLSGLQTYNFGPIISISFWDDYFKPTSYLDKISSNLVSGSHTLCLLDIKVKEQKVENLIKGKLIFEPPKFMTCSNAATQILNIISENPNKVITESTMCIGLARLGSKSQSIFAGSLVDMKDFSDEKLGGPLHSLVVVGRCHPMELSFISHAAGIDLEALNLIYRNHEETLNKNV